MSLTIGQNSASIIAARSLTHSNSNLSQSLQRLSTGYKINNAKDGPADLIKSEKLRAQIVSTHQAISNSRNAASLLETAEGGLEEVNNLLNKMKGLSLKAASLGANGEDQMAAYQAEIDSAISSINGISRNTSFGSKFLLNGSYGFGIEGVDSNEIDIHVQSASFVGQKKKINVVIEEVSQKASVSLALDSNNQLENNQSLTVTGSRGSAQIVFAKGATGEEISSEISSIMRQTGADAKLDSVKNEVIVSSVDYGKNSFIRLTDTDGTSDILKTKLDEQNKEARVDISNQFALVIKDNVDKAETVSFGIAKDSGSATTLSVNRDESSKNTTILLTLADKGNAATGYLANSTTDNREITTSVSDIRNLIESNTTLNKLIDFKLIGDTSTTETFKMDQTFVDSLVSLTGVATGELAIPASTTVEGTSSMFLEGGNYDLLVRLNSTNNDATLTIFDDATYTGDPTITSGASNDVVVKISSANSATRSTNINIANEINDKLSATFTAETRNGSTRVSGDTSTSVKGKTSSSLSFNAKTKGADGNNIHVVMATPTEMNSSINSLEGTSYSTNDFVNGQSGKWHHVSGNTILVNEFATFDQIKASINSDAIASELVSVDYDSGFGDYTVQRYSTQSAVASVLSGYGLPSTNQASFNDIGGGANGVNIDLISDNTGYARNQISLSVVVDTTLTGAPTVTVVGDAITVAVNTDGIVASNTETLDNATITLTATTGAGDTHTDYNGYRFKIVDVAGGVAPFATHAGKDITVTIDTAFSGAVTEATVVTTLNNYFAGAGALKLTATTAGVNVIAASDTFTGFTAGAVNRHTNSDIVTALTADVASAALINATTGAAATEITGANGSTALAATNLLAGGDAANITLTAITPGVSGDAITLEIYDHKNTAAVAGVPSVTLTNEVNIRVSINSGNAADAALATNTNIVNAINAALGVAGTIGVFVTASTVSGGNTVAGSGTLNIMNGGSGTTTTASNLLGGVDSGPKFKVNSLSGGKGLTGGQEATSIIDLSGGNDTYGIKLRSKKLGAEGNGTEFVIRHLGANADTESIKVEGNKIIYTAGASAVDGTAFSFTGFATAFGGSALTIQADKQTAFANQFNWKFNDSGTSDGSANVSYDSSNKMITVNYQAGVTLNSSVVSAIENSSSILDSSSEMKIGDLYSMVTTASTETMSAVTNAEWNSGIRAGVATAGVTPSISGTLNNMVQAIKNNTEANKLVDVEYFVKGNFDGTQMKSVNESTLSSTAFGEYADIFGEYRFSLTGGFDDQVTTETVSATGIDGVVRINDSKASANGLSYSFSTQDAKGFIDIDESKNIAGSTSSFSIVKSGNLMQIGAHAQLGSQTSISFQDISANSLGSKKYLNSNFNTSLAESSTNSKYTFGSLSMLSSGGAFDLRTNADLAVEVLDQAIKEVSFLRADIGALYSMTISSSISSLSMTELSLIGADSLIRDSDYAVEVSNLTRNQIMIQAATSMAAQANVSSQSILQLLN